MKKNLKLAIYLVLAFGLAVVLFVLARSIIDPNSNQTRNQQNNKGPQAVIGQFVMLDPRPPQPKATFFDGSGNEVSLQTFQGKVVLLNIWATWCEPCVKEMPSLDKLQAQLGGDDFAVVAVSADRSIKDAKAFYVEHQIQYLNLYQDTGFEVVQQLYVKGYPTGLPLSVLYDRQGKELARLSGEFDWVSDEAILRIKKAISAPPLPK